MKSPIKFLLLTLVPAIALPVLICTGVFVYWHFRITSALRLLEAKIPQKPYSMAVSQELQHASEILRAGGCRSLPYLIETVQPTREFDLLDRTTFEFLWIIADGAKDGPEHARSLDELQDRFEFRIHDSPQVKRERCDRLKAWWSANKSRHHQWWRVWSSHCRPD